MDVQQKQHLIDLPKTVAGGIATPLAALLTSRFGVAGTMLGLAVSAVTVTVIADTLKVYLARVPGAVVSIPGDLKKKSAWGRFLVRLRLPFSKLASLAPGRRRPILIRSLIGALIMFIAGLVIVTGVELGVGKNLSCWVWDNCYTESSAEGENASNASSLPSFLIAGNSIRSSVSSTPQVSSLAPQQQPAPPPVAPAPPGSQSSSGTGSQPSVSQQATAAPPSEQQSSQSSGYPQQSENQPQGADQQQSGYSQQTEDQQQSPSSNPESEQQSFSSSSETQQQPSSSEQQSPTPSQGADEPG